jgi:hypothetical protein
MRSKQHQLHRDEVAQMLLATGVVLLMSLLSMAVFGVKVAGLTLPHEPTSDGVLDTTGEVVDILSDVVENRTNLWVDAGVDPEQAIVLALDSTQEDLLHHGEIRGVEIKLLDFESTTVDTNQMLVTGELGVSDQHVMMQIDIEFTITIS